VYVQIYIFL
jgi:hypothetical protein